MALLCGALLGGGIVVFKGKANPIHYFGELIWSSLSNSWHYSALIFTIVLGGFAALLQAGGGLSRLFQKVDSIRSLEVRVVGLGFLCFFDGLANSLLLGRLVRPIADRVGVTRERLAYLADSTSSAVACLAPISTWIAMQLGLLNKVIVEREMQVSPYSIFLKSIPLNFYCLLSLGLVLTLVITGKNFGSMAKTTPHPPEEKSSGEQTGSLAVPLISVLSLIVGIPLLYYLFSESEYFPITFGKVITALGSNQGPNVFICASLLSLVLLFILTKMPVKDRLLAVGSGMKQMLLPLAVLICAWFFSSVMKDLGIAKLLGGSFRPDSNIALIPCLVFLSGCLLSFVTGTSWGTMALLFPLAFGVMEAVPDQQLLALFPVLSAAIFSGAVFGDHCSPYSDTTIVSAVAAGCPPYAHVRTQLPYAVFCGVIAALFFLMAGFIFTG